MPDQAVPVPTSPEAQAAGPDVSAAVTPETPQAGTPEQPPQYLTQAELAKYLASNGYVSERTVQSRIDKAVSAVRRQLTGTPDEQLDKLAAKYGVPESGRAAFIEEAKRQKLVAQDAPDEGVEPQQDQANPAGDMSAFWSEWNPRLYEAGLRVGDPELAEVVDPFKFPTKEAYALAVGRAGARAEARRSAEQAKPQTNAPTPSAAAAVFPKGGGGNTISNYPSREEAARAFFGDRG